MLDQNSTIPKGWKITTLGEVAEKIFSGGTPSTQRNDFYGGTIPWLRTQEVNFNYIYDTDIKITQEGLNNSSAKWVPENSVIIAMYGNSAGRVAFSRIKLTTNQACCNFVADKEKSDSKFIYFNLRGRYLEIEGMANGGAQQNLSGLLLKELSLNLPPLPEQRAIGAILSSLDDKIELLREQNKTLEATAQTIFKEWFVNFNFSGATGKMIDSELGPIPEGWRVGKITELGGVITDYVANGSFASLKENVTLYSTENFALFLRNTDLKSGFAQKVYVDEQSYNFLKKTQMFGGEIIISNVGDVGSVYLCPFFKTPMVLGNNTISLKSNYQSFLYTLFTNRIGQFLIESITGGSAQPKFNKTDFRSIRLIIPNAEVLNSFEITTWPLYKKILDSDLQIQTLSTLRDTLLPKLMKGEVRTSELKD